MQILAAGFELAATRQYPEIDKTRYHCTKCRATWYKLANGSEESPICVNCGATKRGGHSGC